MCPYHPNDNHGQNDHGCFATIGDLVEMINPMGERCKIYGVVQEIEEVKAIVPKRILHVYMNWNDGPSIEPVNDAYVRIISRG